MTWNRPVGIDCLRGARALQSCGWIGSLAGPSVRLLSAALACLAALLLMAAQDARAEPIVALEVRDAIGPASAHYVVRGLAHARDMRSPLVVLSLDTPGGLDTSMRQIVQAILASPVPVVVYVSPEGGRAASAGTYILYAAHVAAMAPATTLGAATPVAIGMPGPERRPADEPRRDERGPERERSGSTGRDGATPDKGVADKPMGPADAMTAKQVHDAAAFIRGLAQQRGRNAGWAERAVREAVSLTADEALREKVIELVARDLPDLLAQLDGRTVRVGGAEVRLATRGVAVETVLPDWRQRLLAVIANPSFALILMMLGIYGLVFEFSTPGFGIAGVTGAICLLLALFALQLLPVNYAGLGLILLGMALLAAEVMTPAFGVFGVGGVVAFVVGALLLFDRDVPGFGVPLALIVGLAATSAAVVLLGGNLALRARRRPVVSGHEELLGAVGDVLVAGADANWALVHGERWKVRCEQALLPGQRVRVSAVHGLTLDVQPEAASPSNIDSKGRES